MDRRFTLLGEQVDRRFEQVDQRFEQVDRRLDQVDRRLDQVEQTLLETRRDVAQLQHGQEMILKRMDGQEAWLRLVIGELRAEGVFISLAAPPEVRRRCAEHGLELVD